SKYLTDKNQSNVAQLNATASELTEIIPRPQHTSSATHRSVCVIHEQSKSVNCESPCRLHSNRLSQVKHIPDFGSAREVSRSLCEDFLARRVTPSGLRFIVS
ncbi:hypothetical protein J6590_099420, partial [Homalodisca vitripennis]